MFTVFVYLYLFHYNGGTILLEFVFLFTTTIELYFLFLPYAQSWVRALYIFSFGVDIVFLIVTGKQDAVHLDLRMSFLLFSFDQFNK